MNGEEFYEAFKEAIKFLGIRWGDMGEVTVTSGEGKLTFTANGRSCTVEVKV